MHHWTRRLFAFAAPLLLAGCLWGPGKFASDLTLRKNGSFVLDYRGEMVLQLPPDEAKGEPWSETIAHCYADGRIANGPPPILVLPEGHDNSKIAVPKRSQERPCTAAERAKLKSQYEA